MLARVSGVKVTPSLVKLQNTELQYTSRLGHRQRHSCESGMFIMYALVQSSLDYHSWLASRRVLLRQNSIFCLEGGSFPSPFTPGAPSFGFSGTFT